MHFALFVHKRKIVRLRRTRRASLLSNTRSLLW
jgi:hypothetical protein